MNLWKMAEAGQDNRSEGFQWVEERGTQQMVPSGALFRFAGLPGREWFDRLTMTHDALFPAIRRMCLP